MLTNEQQKKLDRIVHKYRLGMNLKVKGSYELIKAWSERYRIAMERVLQKQGKR